MTIRAVGSPEAYHLLLLQDKEELRSLVELLTVNETYFFREPDHLELVVNKLVPDLLAVRRERPVRILSAGCSTGEEPCSIAMMLRERYGDESERLFAILGVDIDSSAIAIAQKGIYGKSSFRGMGHVILEKFFEPYAQGEFRIRDVIKSQVRYDVVNLLGPQYPQEMQQPDIILYRNVSIYFPAQVQQKIFGRLAGLLTEGGCLLVGATETIPHNVGILSLVERDALFYYQKAPAIIFEERRGTGHPSSGLGHGATHRPKGRIGTATDGNSGATRRHHGHTSEETSRTEPRTRNKPGFTKRNHDSIRDHFDAALDMAHKKQYEEALAILDAILEEDGSFVKAHTLKGSLLLSSSRFDEAAVACDKALAHDSLCLEAYLMLGMIARHKGNDDEALKRFREALYLDASCWLAHFYSSEISFVRQDVKRARTGYETAARILENGSLREHGQTFFPLSFNAEQFIVICRHKLSLLKGKA
jgi:chemotaxis protein methyltransferase CheR